LKIEVLTVVRNAESITLLKEDKGLNVERLSYLAENVAYADTINALELWNFITPTKIKNFPYQGTVTLELGTRLKQNWKNVSCCVLIVTENIIGKRK
jgi:hypothetical protein